MTSLISGVHLLVERLCSKQPLIAVFDFQLEVINYRVLIRINWSFFCPTHWRVLAAARTGLAVGPGPMS